jgi:carbon monoxide dehydrogenase subunit G
MVDVAVSTVEAEKVQRPARTWHKPALMIWGLIAVGLLSCALSVSGIWRITELSTSFQQKDDEALLLAADLKEQTASFAKLTYDFLLQQDFNRQLMREKQSNGIRKNITSDLSQIAVLNTSASGGTMTESVRYNVLQFLLLTDKALETAVEEGSAVHARIILQDEAEPALKVAQEALNALIKSREKFGDEHAQFIRQQAVMVALLLFGLAMLGTALALMARVHVLKMQPATGRAVAFPFKPREAEVRVKEEDERRTREGRAIEARSLITLAVINRLNRLDKENESLKKMISLMQRLGDKEVPQELPSNDASLHFLQKQGEKISQSVGRIEAISEHLKQFMESMNKLMSGIQSMATDGNVVALNVTIELAKLQAATHGAPENEKNAKISEQIRTLATTAAGITGKMAMILSQFRYAQEDFARHVQDLINLKNQGGEALEDMRQSLTQKTQSARSLYEERREWLAQIPMLEEKLENIRKQTTHIQALMLDNAPAMEGETMERSFKVISGGAA